MLKSIRRQGVVADFGSLNNYRNYVVERREDCQRSMARTEAWGVSGPDGPTIAELRRDFVEWDTDLAWVDAELAKEA